MEDTKIVELFWERNQQAIQEIEIKYGRLCIQIAKNITGNVLDAEEIANETYLGLWNAIPPEKPDFLKSFTCRIAKNLAIAKARYNNAEKRKGTETVSLNEVCDILSGSDEPDKIYDRKETAGFISDFLRKCSPIRREMFIQRYWYYRSVKEIASEYNVTESKVKTTLFRVRKELKKYLEKRGVIL